MDARGTCGYRIQGRERLGAPWREGKFRRCSPDIEGTEGILGVTLAVS